MIGALRSEFRKFFTTNFWWMICLSIFGLAAVFGALLAFLNTMEVVDGQTIETTPLDLAKSTYAGPVQFGYLLSLVAGVLTMGSEMRHKTITSTFLSTPNRAVVMAAKILTQVGTGLLMGLSYLAGALAGGGAVLAMRGKDVFPEPADLTRTLVMTVLIVMLWSLVGLGLGILMPMIAAIITGLAVGFILEPLLGMLLAQVDWGKAIAKFLPGNASIAMLSFGEDVTNSPGMPELLNWWQGALVLGGWGLLFALIGTALVMRRDVS